MKEVKANSVGVLRRFSEGEKGVLLQVQFALRV